jgi:hypothetical protein
MLEDGQVQPKNVILILMLFYFIANIIAFKMEVSVHGMTQYI